MPALSFEVGAIFAIDAQPAITSLEAIGQAFSTLETMLQESVAATTGAVDRMITEIARLADAWRAVGSEARAGADAAATGGAGGGGGRRGRADDPEAAARRELQEARLNASAENRDFDARRDYSRRMAAYEDQLRGPRDDGTIGPPGRPYWGQDDDWANAAEENRRFIRPDDGLTIPPPPRAGITEINRSRGELPPRGEMTGLPEYAEGAAVGGAAARGGGHAGGILRGMMPLIAGATTWMAEKGAMTEERSLTQALQEMGIHPGDAGYDAALAELRGAVRGGTTGTIYSESQGANVLPGTAGQFGAVFATPEERLKNYTEILPSAMKFAEVAEQYHRGTMQESMKAAISYAHMTHRYTSDELGGGLDHLLALSLATGETVAGEQGILKYSVPLGIAAGVTPDDAAAMTGFFQVMGFSGTTAATGYGQMLMGLTGTGGPLAAQQHAQRERDISRHFEKALHMEPDEIHARVHATRENRHVVAMQALGLFDEHGKVREDVAPGGKLNQQVFMQHIESYLKTHDSMTDLSTLRDAFTVRGAREGAILQDPAVIEKLNTFIENMRNVQSAEQLQKELQQETLPRFMQMIANINNVGNTLATQTLPGLNSAFGTMNEYLMAANNYLVANPLVAQIGGYALLIGGVATALGLFGFALRPAISVISLLVPGLSALTGGVTAAGAAATEVGLGLSGMIGPIAGLLAVFTGAGFIGGRWARNNLPESVTGSHAADDDIAYRLSHGGVSSKADPADFLRWKQDAPHSIGMATSGYGGARTDPERHVGVAPKPPVTLTMEIRNTFNGVITEQTMKDLVDRMTASLKGFLERAAEMAQGAHQSQYDYSGGH